MAEDANSNVDGPVQDVPPGQSGTDAAPPAAGSDQPAAADPPLPEPAAAGPAPEEFTQADIDAALAVASGGDAGPEPPSEPAGGDTRLDSMDRPFGEAVAASSTEAAPTGQPLELPDFTGDGDDSDGLNHEIDLLHNVGLRVKIELGRTRMFVEDVLKLAEGSVVELDKLAGDPVDVFANDRLIARGEVLVLNDNFCVRVSEVISGQVLAP